MHRAHRRGLLRCAAAPGAGERPQRILAEVSGNILKNVKSVVVPNTGGRRGLPAAIAVGVVAGDPEARLQVIAHVTEEDTAAIQAYLDSTDIRIDCPPTPRMLDIRLTGWAGDHKAVVHVANNHTNIIYVERDGEVLLEKPHSDSAEDNLQDKSVLNVRDILTFAETVDVSRIEESVGRQIDCNTAIAREGCRGTGEPTSAPRCCCPAATWRRRPGPGPPPGPTPG